MLNIVGSKFNTNKENNVGVYVAKLDDSARKHPVKKQPFNALQNVMHNQAVTTPFKNGSNHNHNSAKLLQYSQPRKQFSQDFTTKPQPSFSAQISDMDILLDSFDIDRPCCRKPFKGIEEIWSEMDLIDENGHNRLIKNNYIDIDEENENILDYRDNLSADDDEINFSLTNISDFPTSDDDEFDHFFKMEKQSFCENYDF